MLVMTRCLILMAFLLSANYISGQKIGKFGSTIEKKIGPKSIRVPYTDVISYLGYAEPGSEDEIVEGKKYTYLYVWIPAVAPELGVRMVSPANGKKVKNPILSSNYEQHREDKDFFDTYITLEKSDILSKDNLSEDKVTDANWVRLDYNDDTGELKKQPDGRKYNSLLRYKSDAGDPLKALSVGLYRIGFTTFKTGEVRGTFLAQVGAPIKLPGVIITRDIKEIIAQ